MDSHKNSDRNIKVIYAILVRSFGTDDEGQCCDSQMSGNVLRMYQQLFQCSVSPYSIRESGLPSGSSK